MAASKKESQFTVKTTIGDSEFVRFFSNGENLSIKFSDFKTAMGSLGTIETVGEIGGVPVLDKPTAGENKIRSLSSGAGIIVSTSPSDGISIKWNVTQDATGVSLTSGLLLAKPTIRSLVAGANVTLNVTDEAINIAASAVARDISGFIDYNDTATAATPINIPNTNTFTQLTNDALGGFTNKNSLPPGVTELWQVGTNELDFSELSIGDQVDIRMDIEVTTTAANQEVDLELMLGVGGTPYTLPVSSFGKKSSGVRSLAPFFGLYIGDANTKDNPARIGVKSDTECTVKVKGWYIRVVKRNA